jgi:hypothetical protein
MSGSQLDGLRRSATSEATQSERNVFVVTGSLGERIIRGLNVNTATSASLSDNAKTAAFGAEEELYFAAGVALPLAAGEAVGDFDLVASLQTIDCVAAVLNELNRDVAGEAAIVLLQDNEAFSKALLSESLCFFDEVDDASDCGVAHESAF